MSVTRHYDKQVSRYLYYMHNNDTYHLTNYTIFKNNQAILNKYDSFAVTYHDKLYIIASNKNNLILFDNALIDSIFVNTIVLIRAYGNLIYAQHATGIYKFAIVNDKLQLVSNYQTDKKLRAVCNNILLTNGKNYYYCDLDFKSLIQTIPDDSYFVFINTKNNILHNCKIYNVTDCTDCDIEPGELLIDWH